MIIFSRIRKTILLITFIILAAGIGYNLGSRRFNLSYQSGSVVVNTEVPAGGPADFSLFWDVWNKVRTYHIDREQFDTQKMVWGAISGMVAAIDDPYTTFLPPKENEDFKADLGGQFEGIGAQLGMKEGRVIVVAPLKGSPAELAGIRPQDIILEVNGEDTVGWSVTEAVTKIRGPKGTIVTLTVYHSGDDDTSLIPITRETIKVPSVTSWIKKPDSIGEISRDLPLRLINDSRYVAYIELSRFGDRLAEEWSRAIEEVLRYRDGQLAGLIFDLRNNPGGYLDGSVYIASEFLEKGIVVSQVNSDGSREDLDVNRKGRLTGLPLVVLINKGSASASEIVAGALKDYDRATIVGETSFGKGSVQTPQDLPGGSGLHITTGKWLTPKGTSISKTGITPDITIERDLKEASRDAQLARAVELLLEK